MTDLITELPVSNVTNPVLHWLFKHEWGYPGWGHRPINQVALGLALNDLGKKLADRTLQEEVQALAQKIIVENVRSVTK